jgi:hypothetical protein
MLALEGNPNARATAWKEAGLLKPRETRNLSYSRSEVEELLQRIARLPTHDPPPDDAVPLLDAASRLAKGWYRKTHLLADVFAGRLEVFNLGSGEGLPSLAVSSDDVEIKQAVARLRSLVGRNSYVQLSKANELLLKIWGPMASFDAPEAQQWIARDRLRFRYQTRVYGRRSFPKYIYHAGDLVRISQEMFRPLYFDAELGVPDDLKPS